MQLIPPEIEAYARNHTSGESETVRQLVERSKQKLNHTDMLSGKIVGQLLAMLVHISGARRILEIGTFTGYSALRMAEALPEDGTLITCDTNERYAKIARKAFAESEHGHKITLKMGPALKTIETLSEPFDFIFLDAEKNNYPHYYNAVFSLLKPGALLVIDNVLWGGKVVDPQDEKTQSIHQLNSIIARDERVEQVMLPIRDGVTILRRRR